jgi:hypothetical protein
MSNVENRKKYIYHKDMIAATKDTPEMELKLGR